MLLYTHPSSHSCRRVSAVVLHTGAQVEQKIVDVTTGAHKADDYLKENPNGMVPMLKDGDLCLWESTAIARYLIDQTKSDLLPTDKSRFDAERWIAWGLMHLGPNTDMLVNQNMLYPMAGAATSEDARAIATDQVRRFAGILDDHLDGREWVSGSKLTLADFVLASFFTYAAPAKMPVKELAHINAWLARLDQVPAWRETAPKMG